MAGAPSRRSSKVLPRGASRQSNSSRARPRKHVAQAQPVSQALRHRVPSAALAHRLAEGEAAHHHRRHVELRPQHVALGPHVAGQHVVGQLGGGRHPVLEHHHQVLGQDGIDDALLARVAHDRVVPHREEGAHRVGALAAHGREQRGRVTRLGLGQDVRLVGDAEARRGVTVELGGGHGEQRMGALARASQLLGALLGGKQVERGQVGVDDGAERRPEDVLPVAQVPADGPQGTLGLQQARGVHLHVAHHALENGATKKQRPDIEREGRCI